MKGLKIQPLVLKYTDQNLHKDHKYKEFRQQVTELDKRNIAGWHWQADALQGIEEDVRIGQELTNKQVFVHSNGEYWDSTFVYIIGAPTATLFRKKRSHWFKQLTKEEAEELGVVEELTFKINFETNTLPIPLHDNFAGLIKMK